MLRMKSRWVVGFLAWTLGLLGVAMLVAIQAMASLNDAQQACFFAFPSVPCPGGDDPRVGQLTFAFFGIPLAWLIGIVVGSTAWVARRQGEGHPR